MSDVTSVSRVGGAADRGAGSGRVANADGERDNPMLLRRLEEIEARIRRVENRETDRQPHIDTGTQLERDTTQLERE